MAEIDRVDLFHHDLCGRLRRGRSMAVFLLVTAHHDIAVSADGAFAAKASPSAATHLVCDTESF